MRAKEAEAVGLRLAKKFSAARMRVVRGWVPRRNFVSTKKRGAAAIWIGKQRKRVDVAMRDEDEILFEKALASWEKAFEKLNEICGEAYRAQCPNPEEWPLRYFRWMKVQYMKLHCELGTFYIVPRMPKRKPRVPHWLTADEMIDILANPATVAAIKTFGLPVRPESISGPKRGEKHMIVNLTGDGGEVCRYQLYGEKRRA
jgi:hypothetical protein